MSISPIPSPAAGAAPISPSDPANGVTPAPEPRLTPNPYGIPDSVVLDGARSASDRQTGDMRAAVQHFWNAAIGDDLSVAANSSQPVDARLLHAGLAGATVLTLPAAPEALGLEFAAKQTIKGSVEQLTFHAVGEAAAQGGKLVLQDGVKLTPDEAKFAAESARDGREVVAQPPSGVGRSADFTIDGKPTELKTISHAKPSSAAKAVALTMKKATGQAKNIVIDARGQAGLTEAKARALVTDAVASLPKSRIAEVRFLGREGNRIFAFTVKK